MQLDVTKEQYEAMPEGLRPLVTEKDGKYTFTADTPDEVKGLKSALKKSTETEKQVKERLEALKDVDPEEYKKLKAAADKLDEDNKKKSGQHDELTLKLKTAHKVELDAKQVEIDKRDARIKKHLLDGAIRGEAIKAGVLKDLIDDVVVVTSSRFQLGDDEKIQVLGDDGTVDPGATVEKFFAEGFKEKRPHYYAAANGGGSGADNRGGGAGGTTIKLKRDEVKQNPALYEQAKDRATKEGKQVEFIE
jgi:hypothetical protein